MLLTTRVLVPMPNGRLATVQLVPTSVALPNAPPFNEYRTAASCRLSLAVPATITLLALFVPASLAMALGAVMTREGAFVSLYTAKTRFEPAVRLSWPSRTAGLGEPTDGRSAHTRNEAVLPEAIVVPTVNGASPPRVSTLARLSGETMELYEFRSVGSMVSGLL
jgi:hypothetical protein